MTTYRIVDNGASFTTTNEKMVEFYKTQPNVQIYIQSEDKIYDSNEVKNENNRN